MDRKNPMLAFLGAAMVASAVLSEIKKKKCECSDCTERGELVAALDAKYGAGEITEVERAAAEVTADEIRGMTGEWPSLDDLMAAVMARRDEGENCQCLKCQLDRMLGSPIEMKIIKVEGDKELLELLKEMGIMPTGKAVEEPMPDNGDELCEMVPMTIPWDAIDPKYECAAADKNGNVFAYTVTPRLGQYNQWRLSGGNSLRLNDVLVFNRGNIPWDKSLIKRPE